MQIKKFGLSAFLLVFLSAIALSQAPVYGDDTPTDDDDAASEGVEGEATERADGPPAWAYDAGPDPKDEKTCPEGQENKWPEECMGRELINLNASIPNFPELSYKLMGTQKFRPIYGPIPWRMRQARNSVKILFIGQDGTHIAEAAGRPATAGFGGRAQDLAAYFGVAESAAFINAYAFTIKGQAGSRSTPVVYKKADGTNGIEYTSFTPTDLWTLSYDQGSPITQWRNALIDWILRNNRDSIKLIVLFGGAAREAAAAFIESSVEDPRTGQIVSRGGKVGANAFFVNKKPVNKSIVQVPLSEMVDGGSNAEFAVPVNAEGNDLYKEILGASLDYSKPADQANAQNALRADLDRYMEQLVFTKGGPMKNGLLHDAQLGGYDVKRGIIVNGKKTLSLQGLKLSDGTTIKNDVLVVQFPHPTSLSKNEMENPGSASAAIAKALEDFGAYAKDGWFIKEDPGMVNQFAKGMKYKYGRSDIGPEYYDFGATKARMVSVSSASRMGGKPNVIVFGTREKPAFDMRAIDAMTKAKPAKYPAADEMFTTRPRGKTSRYVFDPGPGAEFAKLMKQLDFEKLYASKPGMVFSQKVWNAKLKKNAEVPKDGIKTFYIKSHPKYVGDYGHYRGTFEKPRVVILADPDGHDDLITARALTGARGQYLHGLMEDLGVGDKYLVIKTVPFSMDGATAEDWEYVRKHSEQYRKDILDAVVAQGWPELILADGPIAKQELQRIYSHALGAKIEYISREGGKKDAGIAEVAPKLQAALNLAATKQIKPRMADIPRKHLSYYARLWEGTSGDRVITSSDGWAGLAFAEVAPQWAWRQKIPLTQEEQQAVDSLLKKLEKHNFPLPGESVPDYLERVPSRNGFLPQLPETFFAAYQSLKRAS